MAVPSGNSGSMTNMKLRHILLLGLALRLVWALAVPIVPVSDSVIYDMFAQRIADGHGYSWPDGRPSVYWAAGASAIYGGIFHLFGHSYAMAAALNLVMGCLLIAAIYHLARTRFDEAVSLTAAFLAAIWPTWIAFTSILSSELPGNLLMTAGMAAIMSRKRGLLLRIGAGSLCLIAAAFVRPTFLPLIVAVPLLDGAMRRDWRGALTGSILAAMIAAAALAPWAARNQAYFGKAVLVSANFGANLWMGNNPASNGGYMPLPDGLPDNEVVRDDLLKARAMDFIVNNPARFVELSLRRVMLSFGSETIAVHWNEEALPAPAQWPLKLVMSSYWIALFLWSLIGAGLFIYRDPIRLFDPMIFAMALGGAVVVLVVGMDRYHLGLMPFVAIFAAHALHRATGWFTSAWTMRFRPSN